MSITGVLRNQLLSFFRLISAVFARCLSFLRFRSSDANRIGELPYVLAKEDRRTDYQPASSEFTPLPVPLSTPSNPVENSWTSWDDRRFGVDLKIAEYRQNLAESHGYSNASAEPEEPNLFDGLQPEVKEARKYMVKSPRQNDQPVVPRSNLFNVQDVPIYDQAVELGEIDLDEDSATAWGAEDEVVDQALAADKRQLLEQKRRQRQQDHERRIAEKKAKLRK